MKRSLLIVCILIVILYVNISGCFDQNMLVIKPIGL